MNSTRSALLFWAKVRIGAPDECWEWTGATRRGYGRFGRPTRMAHRIAWARLRGPVPDGLVLDHLCRNTLCVNPSHLEPVTAAENSRRQWAAAPPCRPLLDLCKRGHEMIGRNVKPIGAGRRECRACANLRKREARTRAKELAA